jgi:DNA-binding winged helix-turn-helix (wHTH) protein
MEHGRVPERGSRVEPEIEAASTRVFRFPPFRLEVANERLWREHDSVALKPRAFAILLYLVEHPHRIVTKAELLAQLWGGVHVNDAVLKTHLGEIRRALGDDVRSPRYIETAHRRGYRFIAATLEAPEVSLAARATRGPAVDPGTAAIQAASVGAASALTHPPAGAGGPVASASPESRSQTSVAVAPAPMPPTPERAPKPAFAPQPYFVGRQAELEWLQVALGQARLGQRQVVLVSGPVGSGKTSLLRAFASRLPPAAGSLAWGQCVEQAGTDEAYLPLIDALSRLGRGPDRARWVEHLSRCAPSWVARLPSLQTSTPARGAGVPSSEHMLHQLADALETFTEHELLVLVLEDIQWADASTLAWLTYMACRNESARLLVVGTFRPLHVSRGAHPLAALERALERQSARAELELPCLRAAEVASYVAARFPEAEMRRELVALLHARSAGNPLFMVRVFDSWLERRVLWLRAGHWQLAGSGAALERETPACVVSLIEQEYEQLTEFERDVVEAASVAGAEFSAASVAAALSADLLGVEALCVRWAKHGQFFHVSGKESWPDGTQATRFGFVHSLYREAAYERLGAARQALLHIDIARWQEQAYGDRSVEIAPELAFHFERARDYRRAALHLCSAGERAVAQGAHGEASAHFERGLALLAHLPYGVQRARLEIRLQVGIAALLAATHGHAVEKERAARTAAAAGRQFLAAANARDDQGAALCATLLLGMAEACLGNLQSARSRLEETTSRYAAPRSRVPHTAPMIAALPSRRLPERLAPGLPAATGAGEAMIVSTELPVPHGAALALTWRAMLRSFLSEAAANDADALQAAADDTARGLLESDGQLARHAAGGSDHDLSGTRASGSTGSESEASESEASESEASESEASDGAEPSLAVNWVEGLLRQALADVDSWFGDETAIQNDLDAFEPRHGYRFERRTAEGSRRGSPAALRD